MITRGAGSPAAPLSLDTQLYRLVWPDGLGFTAAAAFRANWLRPDGEQVLLWAGAAGQGNMQRRVSLPGALKGLDTHSVFASSAYQMPVVLNQSPNDEFTTLPVNRALAWRSYFAVDAFPNADDGEMGTGLIMGFGTTPDPLNAAGIILNPTAAGSFRVLQRLSTGGAQVVLDTVQASAFPLGTSVPTLVEWWLLGADQAQDARLQLWIAGVLILTVTGTDLPSHDAGAGDLRWGSLRPMLSGPVTPRVSGAVWHGPGELFYSLTDRGGAPL